jgi:hypothetical protein
MRFGPYRQVMSLPGMRPLMLLAIIARVPVVAVPITLTLHVVLDLDRGYGAAGALGAVVTLASAPPGPVLASPRGPAPGGRPAAPRSLPTPTPRQRVGAETSAVSVDLPLRGPRVVA